MELPVLFLIRHIFLPTNQSQENSVQHHPRMCRKQIRLLAHRGREMLKLLEIICRSIFLFLGTVYKKGSRTQIVSPFF